MQLRSSPALLALLLTASLSFVVSPPRLRADEKINEAIDHGIEYLLAELEKSITPAGNDTNRVLGQMALEAYALVVAGVSVDHPLVKKHFEYLGERMTKSSYTYGLSLYIFALDAAIAQEEADFMLSNMDTSQAGRKFRDNPNIGREYRANLTDAINRMVGIRQPGGGWNYGPGGGRFDNSNTQFAVLALGVGLKRNIPIDLVVWEKILEHFVKGQQKEPGEEVKDRLTLMTDEEVIERRLRGSKENPKEKVDVEVVKKEDEKKDGDAGKGASKGKSKSGTLVAKGKTVTRGNPDMPSLGTEHVPVFRRGWDYENKGGANWNMTCAGLSSLLLARQALKGRIPPSQMEAVNAAVRDGYGWIMTNWAPTGHAFYGMYSLEKVADIGEVKKFGTHDWYAELSGHLLSQQAPDGHWPGSEHGSDQRLTTGFALLILNRATQIVMMSLLSQNPISKIVLSGKRSQDSTVDRSWVYLPELDTTIHYPTLLRTIRQRAHPKLMKFLKSVVQYYPDEAKGELIPDLAQARDEIFHKEARKIVESLLTEVTGSNYQNAADYLKWYERWERVRLIGQQQKTDRIPDLLQYYAHTQKSVPLKKTIMWALVQCKASQAIPLFLADLEHSDARVRNAAYDSFRAFYLDFPPSFDAAAAENVRAKQIEALKTWKSEQDKKRS